MNSRVLPILNAVGCLVLTGLVVAQWNKERALDRTLPRSAPNSPPPGNKPPREAKRAAALERDIAVLKESIEATQQAAEEPPAGSAEKETQAAGLETEITTAREQVTTWESHRRPATPSSANSTRISTATRQRLDEAIAKLKAAAGRN